MKLEPLVVAQILLSIVAASILFYRISHYFWLKNYAKLQRDMSDRISDALDKIAIDEGVPVVAVERFLMYLNHPDPTFEPAAIIRQERDNSKTKIGSAKE